MPEGSTRPSGCVPACRRPRRHRVARRPGSARRGRRRLDPRIDRVRRPVPRRAADDRGGTVGLFDGVRELSGSARSGSSPEERRGSGGAVGHRSGVEQLVRVDPDRLPRRRAHPGRFRAQRGRDRGGFVWVANTDERRSPSWIRAPRVVQTIMVGNGPTGIVGRRGPSLGREQRRRDRLGDRRADGAVLDTYPVGERPCAAAIAGAIWVANHGRGDVSRVVSGTARPSDPRRAGPPSRSRPGPGRSGSRTRRTGP